MSNDSSTGGPLLPEPTPPNPGPLEGQSLDQFLQQLVVGLTAYPPTLVRPRWQPEPPNQPTPGTDWAAIGIVSRRADTFAAMVHHASLSGYPNGVSELQRQETFDLLCSFFGPNAEMFSALLRDGLAVSQNREVLQLAGMGLIECTGNLSVPALTNQRWIYRTDMTVRFRRVVVRYYPILNLLSAPVTITIDQPALNIPVPHDATQPGW